MVMWEYKSIKTYLEKVTLRIILKNFFVIEKVKTARKKTLMVKKLFESSIKKIKKQIKHSLELVKQ